MQETAFTIDFPTLRTVVEASIQLGRECRPDRLTGQTAATKAVRNWWRHARELQRGWQEELSRWEMAFAIGDGLPVNATPIELLLSTVLVCEVSFRVTATLLSTVHLEGTESAAPELASHVMDVQAQIRGTVLKLLTTFPAQRAEVCLRVDRLRRRCELWTDVLIARLATTTGNMQFATSNERAADFGESRAEDDAEEMDQVRLRLIRAGLQDALMKGIASRPLQHGSYAGLVRAMWNLHQFST